MPHLIVEYPADRLDAVRVEALLDGLHRAMVASGLFEPGHIRIRAVALHHYRRGGERQPFIHLQCRLHAGRDDEQKRALGEALVAAAHGTAAEIGSITAEMVELDRASYAKHTG